MPRSLFAAVTIAAFFAIHAPPVSAQQQGTAVNVRGTVASLEGNVLSVKGATSTTKVALPESVRVQYFIKTDLSKIGPGSWVGISAQTQPDGSSRAIAIQLFADQVNHPAEADRPWDIAPQATMTNAAITTISDATVGSVQGRMLVIKLKDGERKIFVPPDAQILTSAPADRTALTPGASVLVFAVRGDDGSVTGRVVFVGKDGLAVNY
jgi:hypothetical protein